MRTVLKFLIPVFIVGLIFCFVVTESVIDHGELPAGFVNIKGGTFTMGSPASEVDREDGEVQHRVTVNSFYMSKYEVTQEEYRDVMGENPSKFKGDNLPVEGVSWYEAVAYCNKRSVKEGLTPVYSVEGEKVTWNKNANGYRLPTEAEWEYACRAGTTTPFSTGKNITTKQANYDYEKTTPVGSYKPNAWGLYDMHGNVFEWCWDWGGDYGSGAQTNPVGAAAGSYRVIRGGSWYDVAGLLRSAFRCGSNPVAKYWCNGFRVVRS